MPTTPLDLIRDDSVSLAELARHFDAPEAFAAGLCDAVTGDTDWSLHAEGAVPAAEREDYLDGHRHGVRLLEEEAEALGWADCHALAGVEALQLATPAGICDDD